MCLGLERLVALTGLLLLTVDGLFSVHTLDERVSHLQTLMRTLMPDLFAHFQDEEVDFREIASSWFIYLLSREMHLPCVLRLWDTYFADTDGGLNRHVYICLAVLMNLREELEG